MSLLYIPNSSSKHSYLATTSKPNIIIIGIDALRPDFLGYYNHSNTSPFIDEFLKSSTVFSQSYTPLARTFPAWTSILTGKYPIHNYARGNNTDLSLLDLSDTLPKRLHAANYETIYSTDDTRFNNTNSLFGFDKIITPPMGLNDFILGTINDFPLTNLIVPTPLGKILFPYSYANHGAASTYKPQNFLNKLKIVLSQRKNKPLFMCVHFTITHWPFHWYHDKLLPSNHEAENYISSITAADRQVKNFFTVLKENGLLTNTIVILLSDHGIALGLHNDRLVKKENYIGDKKNIKKLVFYKYAYTPEFSLDFKHDYGIDTSYGYGGDILTLKAYHNLFAMKGYGVDLSSFHEVNFPTSLIDIAPTLLDLLHLPPIKSSDGTSLKKFLFLKIDKLKPDRPLFLETSFSLDEIEKEGISVSKVLQKVLHLYHLDLQSGLIFIDPQAEKVMNKNKEFAIIQGDWILAHFPEMTKNHFKMIHGKMTVATETTPAYIVLLNLKTGKWTTESNLQFAQKSPFYHLKEELYHFYKNELR